MTVESSIKHGDQAAEAKDFLTAISKYSEALKENPNAFLALVKRAQVHTKLSDYALAKADISRAFLIAEERGRMADKATCHYRLGLVGYAEGDWKAAHVNFVRAKELKCTEPALDIWLEKTRRDAKKHGVDLDEAKPAGEPEKQDPAPQASSSISEINKHNPIAVRIRDEWYQSKTSVTITIFAPGVPADKVKVEFTKHSVAVEFPTATGEYHYLQERLYGEIVPGESLYLVLSKKIEIVLKKVMEGTWPSLEAADEPKPVLGYPSSLKKAVDWSRFEAEDDEKEDFFEKLYKDVDEDTRRAMMKSYVESNGTVLTTNWAEAKTKTFETSPPEGMQAKKW